MNMAPSAAMPRLICRLLPRWSVTEWAEIVVLALAAAALLDEWTRWLSVAA